MTSKRTRLSALLLLSVGIILCCSCTSRSEPDQTQDSSNMKPSAAAQVQGKALPAAPLMDDNITCQFAIYYLPTPQGKPLEQLDRLLKGEFKSFQKVDKLVPDKDGMLVAAKVITDVQESYVPPDMNSLKYFGRGLSREQAESLPGFKDGGALGFRLLEEASLGWYACGSELTNALAVATGGLLWDEDTREVFSPAEWGEEANPHLDGSGSRHLKANRDSCVQEGRVQSGRSRWAWASSDYLTSWWMTSPGRSTRRWAISLLFLLRQ